MIVENNDKDSGAAEVGTLIFMMLMVFMIFLWIKWGGEGMLFFSFLIGGMVYLAGEWDTDFYDSYSFYDFYHG